MEGPSRMRTQYGSSQAKPSRCIGWLLSFLLVQSVAYRLADWGPPPAIRLHGRCPGHMLILPPLESRTGHPLVAVWPTHPPSCVSTGERTNLPGRAHISNCAPQRKPARSTHLLKEREACKIGVNIAPSSLTSTVS